MSGRPATAETADVEALCERVLILVAERAEAEVNVSRTRHGLTRFANSAIHQHVGEETTSVRLRLAADGRVAATRTTRLDSEGLAALVERTFEATHVRPVDADWPGLAAPAAVPDPDHLDPTTALTDPVERVAHVDAFVDAGDGMRAAGYVDTELTVTAFANSAGQRAAAAGTRATLDAIHQTDTSAGMAHRTSSAIHDLNGGLAGRAAARLARDSQHPEELEPGRYEVVLSPECVATTAIFLAFYGFNAKQHLEGQSFVELGVEQFDPAFSLWDDATDPRALGAGFDAEGTPKGRLVLVEAGTSRALVHDRRTALRAGTDSTGHAVPGGESWGAIPSDLFVARGGTPEDELVAGVERGILVTTFHYCRILDPKTQVVTGLTRNGTFLIEDGEVTRPLANLRFTQSFVEALAPGQVRAVGAATRFADSEFGPGIVVAPAMHLAEWNFTGGASG
jgi:predicted Zn-dependent protease